VRVDVFIRIQTPKVIVILKLPTLFVPLNTRVVITVLVVVLVVAELLPLFDDDCNLPSV
jgi:hypothetical protein